MSNTELFGTVADKDYLGLLAEGEPRIHKVAGLLGLNEKDVASATGIARASIRFTGAPVPDEVMARFREWAQALNLVAQVFEGDHDKTVQWFKVPNPLLGGVSPSDMIRFGRFHRLAQFIREAISDTRDLDEPTA